MIMELEHIVNSTLIPEILPGKRVMVFEKRLDSEGLLASRGVIRGVELRKGIHLKDDETGRTRIIPFCHLFGGIVYIMEPREEAYNVLYKNEAVIDAYKNCNYTELCLMLDPEREKLIDKGRFYTH